MDRSIWEIRISIVVFLCVSIFVGCSKQVSIENLREKYPYCDLKPEDTLTRNVPLQVCVDESSIYISGVVERIEDPYIVDLTLSFGEAETEISNKGGAIDESEKFYPVVIRIVEIIYNVNPEIELQKGDCIQLSIREEVLGTMPSLEKGNSYTLGIIPATTKSHEGYYFSYKDSMFYNVDSKVVLSVTSEKTADQNSGKKFNELSRILCDMKGIEQKK